MKLQTKQTMPLPNSNNYRNIGKPNLTPTKKKVLMGVTFSKKDSIRTLNSSTRDSNPIYNRCLTYHSIEEIHHSKSIENAQHQTPTHSKHEDGDDMFSRSYAKIQKMKGTLLNKNIDDELNDILLIIKEEKQKIRDRIKKIQASNNYYQKISKGAKIAQVNAGINTEQFINDGMEAEYVNKQIQCEESELKIVLKKDDAKQKKQMEAYKKLQVMLVDMNINPQQILHEECIMEKYDHPFKVLSDTQIIKIQQFFIKKLAAKIPK